MLKYALPALCATTLWAALMYPAQAQVTAKKPVVKAASAVQYPGSVNGKPVTWVQLINSLRANSPDEYDRAVAQAIGSQARNLFGATPQKQVTVTITQDQVVEAVRKKPTPAITNELGMMLRDEAIQQEAAKAGVKVTNADVNGRVTKIVKDLRRQQQVDPSITDDQFLTTLGVSRAGAQRQIRSQMLAYALMDKDLAKQLGHPVGPDDFVQASHILIMVKEPAPDAKPEEGKKSDQEALAKLTAIESDIKSGKKKFEDAAKENSEDGTKEQGGSLGAFMRGMMVKEFENSAFSMKPGEISKPVRSQFGYHLIRLDKTGRELTPAERDQVLERYHQSRNQQFLPELMTTRARVVNNLRPPTPAMPSMGGPRPGMRPMPRPVPPAPAPPKQ